MVDGITVEPDGLRQLGNTVGAAIAKVNRPAPVPPSGPGEAPPGREFSYQTVGDLWSSVPVAGWIATATQLRAHAAEHDDTAAGVRRSADGFGADNSGAMVDAAIEKHHRDAAKLVGRGSVFFADADAIENNARQVRNARDQMEQTDQQTHQQIEQIRGSARGGDAATRMAAHQAILSALGEARASSETAATAVDFTLGVGPEVQPTGLRGGSEPGEAGKGAPRKGMLDGVRGGSEPVAGEHPLPAAAGPAAAAAGSAAAGGVTPAQTAAGSSAASMMAPAGAAARPAMEAGTAMGRPAGLAAFGRGVETGLAGAAAPAPARMPTPAALPGYETAPPPTMTAGAPVVASPQMQPNASPVPSPTLGAAPPAGPVGPLPPFGSDIPRPAAAAAPPPPTPPVSTAAGPVVTPSVPAGVGVTAGVSAVVRSLIPDRHLQDAVNLVNELQRASREYGCIDWCAGVFLTRGGPVMAVTSNEGAGYVPVGVLLPDGAHLLWTESAVADGFRERWFGWANPAATMVAYADLVVSPGVELVALGVSINDGGSAAPARLAHVHEYAETDLAAVDDAEPGAGQTGMHRLAVIDPREYARVTTTDMEPNYGGLLEVTTSTVMAVLAVARGGDVPAILAQVNGALQVRRDVTAEQWSELEEAAVAARFAAAAHRPGRITDTPSPVYRAAHDVARAAELLGYWNADPPQWAEIAYTTKQIVNGTG